MSHARTLEHQQCSLEDLINKNNAVIKPGLSRIRAFLNFIGNPEQKFMSVLIGGTNGKGSVTTYLARLACKNTKYIIGRYTSPHIVSFEERFVINEKPVNKVVLKKAAQEILQKIKSINSLRLTTFEIYTAIAFYLFAKLGVEVAFVEVGMGGRLDATNVIPKENILCSIITSVDYDHMKFLGNTLEKIAYEKAGIIKEKNYIIVPKNINGLKIIKEEAKKLKSKLILDRNNDGTYFDKNINLALTSWNIIAEKLKIKPGSKFKNKALLKKITLTGRFQYIKKAKILLDSAHNPSAALELKKLIIKKNKHKKILYIIGMLDKDYKNFIKNLIPKGSHVICTEPKSTRKTRKELLAKEVKRNNSLPILASDIKDALNKAKNIKHNIILVTGSIYLVGEALYLINRKTNH